MSTPPATATDESGQRRHEPPRLYLVTDRKATARRPLLDVIERALVGGVDTVQLREKDLTTRELLALAEALLALCRRYRARLLVNDRVDVALAVGADGVHLPANSFAAADARRLLGDRACIGASTHSLADARAAAAAGGADFVVFGPIYETPSKRAYGAPLGLAALADVAAAVPIPVVAIGGLDAARAAEARAHGAAGVAAITAILAAADPKRAAEAMLGLESGER